MASYTSHYHLKKPDGTEDINVNDINSNMDTIDTELYDTFRYRGSLTSSGDANNLTGNGYWRIDGSVPANVPAGYTWCFLFQFVVGTVTQQYLIKPAGGSLLIREYTGSPQVWSSWISVSEYTAPVRINYGSNSYVEYWRNGRTACLKILYYVSDGTVASWTVKEIATIPAGFRPAQVIMQRGCVDRAGDEGTCFSVDSNGSVKIQTRFNSFDTGGDALQGTITYPIRY